MVTEPHEGIDPYNNQEAKAAARFDPPVVARGPANVAPETTHAPADEQPGQEIPGGTSGGDPLSGLVASAEDIEAAVPGDTGPELPGQR